MRAVMPEADLRRGTKAQLRLPLRHAASCRAAADGTASRTCWARTAIRWVPNVSTGDAGCLGIGFGCSQGQEPRRLPLAGLRPAGRPWALAGSLSAYKLAPKQAQGCRGPAIDQHS